MKEKLVLSVLVDNESGVLQRVASLFSRRAYNGGPELFPYDH